MLHHLPLFRVQSRGWRVPRFARVLGLVLLSSLIGLPTASAAPAADDADESPAATQEKKSDTEFTIVPFVGGNSDSGFGGGYIASLARLEPGREPYYYRFESAGTMTFAPGEGGGVQIPYVDNYLLFSFPHVVKDRLGIDLRISYTREATLKYYGVGNASTIPAGLDPSAAYFEYVRVHPTFRASLEYRLRPLVLSFGSSYTQNILTLTEAGKLETDLEASPYLRELLGNAQPHGVLDFSVGVAWDSRDDETSPTRGLYVTERLDVTPGTFGEASYQYGRLGTAAHAYLPIISKDKRLTLAVRLVSDFLFGDPPFYELPRFDNTSAIGGAKGVRGVPAGRYYGKIKAFGNVELRSELFALRIFGEPRRFGLTAFADGGRLWADYRRNPELDGTGLGLKYGLGGGLRVASGKTFVLRLDVAWSPDAHPVSGYLLAGHMF